MQFPIDGTPDEKSNYAAVMAEKLRNDLKRNRIQSWVNGAPLPSDAGLLDVIEPARGEKIAELEQASPNTVEKAMQAAEKAFPAWSHLSIKKRADHLIRWAELIEKNIFELATLESIDSGKPFRLAAESEVPRAPANLRFFAEHILHAQREAYDDLVNPGLHWIQRRPLGPVTAISPWNLPILLFTWKIAPALATGNTVVAKPSEITPLTAHRLCQLAAEAGLPDGVFNVIQGSGAPISSSLVTHPLVRAVTFTGSTTTGRAIQQLAAPHLKKTSLELGGKNAVLIFEDCDFELTLQTVLRSSFQNQGQICLCGSRILVSQKIYQKFRDAFVERVRTLRQNDPLHWDTDQGALVSEAHFKKVESCVDRARTEGGAILIGGKRTEMRDPKLNSGYFYQPTVIENLPMSCATNQEEIFGPVVTLTPFSSTAEAVALANQSTYGLAASVWTQDTQKAMSVSSALETGMVWINSWMVRDLRVPFGGSKQSGMGREGGDEALRFFTESKSIFLHYSRSL